MTIEQVAPATVAELAAMSSNLDTLYFGIGTAAGNELLCFTAANLIAGEALVAIVSGAGCLEQLEPERTPAIGAWCSQGTLIGFEYDPKSIAELMEDARRFAPKS
jgi:hypothetical protein